MSENANRRCLFLPCSDGEIWALPKNCLAEIITLYKADEKPPAQITWRGHEVPVVDVDTGDVARWRDSRSGTALVAVLLGIEGLGCEYLGIAMRGLGLSLQTVPEDEVEECPEQATPASLGAFRWRGVVYQVPDLLALQARIASERAQALAEDRAENRAERELPA